MRSTRLGQILLAILTLILISSTGLRAGQQTRNVLAPTQVSPPPVGPFVTTVPFDVGWPVSCPCTVRVTNGSANSGPLSHSRVTFGWVWINNTLVMTPLQLNALTGSTTAMVNLPAGAHRVHLQLAGWSSSYVSIRVSGTIVTTNLSTPRANHTATLMPDGSVLIAGGEGAAGILSSVEQLTADVTAASPAASMASPRAGHSASLLPGGRALIAAGRDTAANLGSTELLTAAGVEVGAPLDDLRHGHTSTTLPDGRMLILGGHNGAGVPVTDGVIVDPRPDPFTDSPYDPTAPTVTSLGDALQVARADHTATLLPDGRVLIIGGHDASTALSSIEVFDPETNTSSLLPFSLATPRSHHTATLRPNGNVLVIGGSNNTTVLSSIERVRPTQGDVQPAGAITLARAGHTATIIRNGEILIAGGSTASGPTANTELATQPTNDVTAPAILATFPIDASVDADRATVIGLQATEPLDPSTVNSSTAQVRNSGGGLVAATAGIADHGTVIAIVPEALLAADTYTVSVAGVADRVGNPISPTSVTFTVVPAPTITAIVPAHGVAGSQVTINGVGFGDEADDHQLSFNGTQIPATPVDANTLTAIVPSMGVGNYAISLRTRGGVAHAPTAFAIVNPAPTLESIAPSTVNAGSAAFALTLTGANFVNGSTAMIGSSSLATTVVSSATLTAEVPAALVAAPGTLTISVVNPSPGGGTSATLPLVVESVGPPPQSVTMFPRGMSLSIGGTHPFTAEAAYADGSTAQLTNGASWSSSAPGVLTTNASGVATAVSEGTAVITVTFNGLAAQATVRVYAGEAIPPDPVDVAPLETESVEATQMSDSTRFLYEGPNPIQRDVVPGAIEAKRVAVLRGEVRSRDGQPLAGVRVTITDDPELGYTLTRLDGAFDMAVNGGGSLVVRFTKDGYLPIERRSVVQSAEFFAVDAAVMIPVDGQVTMVDLTSAAPITVARGTVVTDASGSRQATVLFPQGTTATLQLPDGTMQPLTTLHVRATEYTVGPNGPAAMPGTLPPASAYTYAVELSADEALAAGATSIQFSTPVPTYTDNFIGFPAGTAVPTGYYDRTIAAWVPSPNGIVLKILAIDVDGRAELDLTGDDLPDDSAALTQIGISDAERLALGSTYAAGASLWRVPVTHFTPFDHNWPRVPVEDADTKPELDSPQVGDETPPSETRCQTPGSIIDCQDQVLGERLPVTGTPFTLNYRSDRMPGRSASSLKIPLSEATVPASMAGIELSVNVAGQQLTQSFPAAGGQVAEFNWNGRDAYGRFVKGEQQARIEIRHLYPFFYVSRGYYAALQSGTALFGLPSAGGVAAEIYPGRGTTPVTIRHNLPIGAPPSSVAPLAGWSLDVHHSYLPASGKVLFGDGRQRNHTAAGVSVIPMAGVEWYQHREVAGGFVYYTDYKYSEEGQQLVAVFKRSLNDLEAPAIELGEVPYTVNFVVDPDGDLVYYAGCETEQQLTLFRVAPGVPPAPLATATMPPGEECDGTHIARAADGTLFVNANTEVFQKLPGGPLVAIGGLVRGYSIAVGHDGALYRVIGYQIERLDPTGAITLFAGSATGSQVGVGQSALEVRVGGGVHDLAVAGDGSLLVVSQVAGYYRLHRITPSGRIFTIAGGVTPSPCCLPDPPQTVANGAPASSIRQIEQVSVGDDGWVYMFRENVAYRFRPTFAEDLTVVAADDGSEFYEFDATGRHLRTRDALTGATRYSFAYDDAGRLTAITDGDGLVTQIQRDGNGTPTALVAPFGQTTTFQVDSEGWLSQIVAPGSRTTKLTSTASGLLTHLEDPNGNPFTFAYDNSGRLINDAGPAGGSETLARTLLPDGAWETRVTSTMGRMRRYRTQLVEATGAQLLTVTAADGTSSTTTAFPDNSQETVSADGMRTTVTMGADLRFGFDAPVAATTVVRSPVGRQSTTTKTRAVSLPNPLDLSTLVQTEKTTINGRQWQTVYTGATRTLRTTSPAGRVTTATFDALGRVSRTQVGTLMPTDFTFDSQGRLTTTTQGSRTSTIAYDVAGRLLVLTDALAQTTSFGYDAADRVTTQTLNDTRTIGFSYDSNDNLTTLTPPGRSAHVFTFTPVNLTASYTPPPATGAGSTGYSFNADRQPTEVQRPDGQATLFSYAPASGRLTSVTFSRGALNYGYDAAGRISSLADPGGVSLGYTYDGALQLRETWSGGVTGSVSRTFDNDFGVATEQVNNTFNVAFTYDSDRLLTGAGAMTVTRHPQHGLVTLTTLGTTTDTYTHNGFGERERQTAVANGTQVFDAQMQRDQLGRISQRIEVVDGITRVFRYGYDTAGRLGSVTRNGDLVARYAYDSNGNRLGVEGEAGLVAATYDDQDRLVTYGAAAYTYTPNGELATKTVAGQTTSYVYDTLGSLIRVTKPNGDVITYTVDGRGRRLAKAVNGVRVKGWLYADQLRPVAELTASGLVQTRFVYGTKPNVPEYMIRSNVTYRIVSDHLGSPRVVVNVTTGAIVQRMDFQAFGEIIQDSNPGWQPFGFAGGLYDPDTALLRFGFRDYDPALGRWTMADPIKFTGGASNLYAYSGSDPVNNIDPSGLFVLHPLDLVDYASFSGDLLSFLGCPGWGTGGALALSAVGLLPGVTGLGWADEAGDLGRVVIGENMDRVRAAAEKYGADFFKGLTEAENLAWIQDMVKNGKEIIDIGPDFARRAQRAADGDRPDSRFYNLERRATKAYDKYVKAFTRPGK